MDTSGAIGFLRRVLLADAVVSGATGLVLALGAPWLADLLALPPGLLRGAGMVLVPYATIVAIVAARRPLLRAAVWTVIAANVLWAVDSVALLLSGWAAPNVLGMLFVGAQAAVVAAFAVLQYRGARGIWPGLRQRTG